MTQDTCEEWAALFGPLSLLLQVEEKENVMASLFSLQRLISCVSLPDFPSRFVVLLSHPALIN